MRRLAFAALTFAGLAWGLGFPLGKIALRETDAAHVVLLRFFAAAVAAAPFALRTPAARALFRSPVVLGAGMLYGLGFLVQFEGLARASVTLAALMVGAMPALIALTARALGEKISRTSWIGVAAATLGAALIAGRPGGAATPLGVALSLSGLGVFLLWLQVLRHCPKSPTPLALPAVMVLISAATLLPLSWLLHGPPRLDLSPAAWAGIACQGVVSTFCATAAWQYGAARVSSAASGVFINIEPLMGAAIGVALFGDHLTLALAAGGAMIVAGSFVTVLGERAASDLTVPPPTPA